MTSHPTGDPDARAERLLESYFRIGGAVPPGSEAEIRRFAGQMAAQSEADERVFALIRDAKRAERQDALRQKLGALGGMLLLAVVGTLVDYASAEWRTIASELVAVPTPMGPRALPVDVQERVSPVLGIKRGKRVRPSGP